jgi:putative transposase
MTEQKFDFEAFKREAIRKLRNKEPITGKDSIFQPLLKQLLEEALDGELDAHLSDHERLSGNRRNGKTSKIVKTGKGAFELTTPRDRDSTFEPQIVSKRQVFLTEEIEEKVLRLYSKGLSTRDIASDIEEMYGYSISPTTLSSITDKVIPAIKEWQQRPLEDIYCIVWMDAMFFKVREEGLVKSKVLYNIIGINPCGEKDLIGMYLSDSEGATFWMQVLNDLKSRGLQDILIACIDNLKGFEEAIKHLYPKTDVQSCVVHQIRNSVKYVSSKDIKAFMADLKQVYRATNKELAEFEFDKLAQKWEKKYPGAVIGWRNNWHKLSTFFRYPDAIRKIMYTTNTIEAFHRQVRKITKTKGAFTSDIALLKLVYLASVHITEKWNNTNTPRRWMEAIGQLQMYFPDRLTDINRVVWFRQ